MYIYTYTNYVYIYIYTNYVYFILCILYIVCLCVCVYIYIYTHCFPFFPMALFIFNTILHAVSSFPFFVQQKCFPLLSNVQYRFFRFSLFFSIQFSLFLDHFPEFWNIFFPTSRCPWCDLEVPSVTASVATLPEAFRPTAFRAALHGPDSWRSLDVARKARWEKDLQRLVVPKVDVI